MQHLSPMSEIYEFSDLRLDVRERVLQRIPSGERVALPEKAFDTLCLLVKNGGRLMGKEELLDQVWADAFVEENNLNKSIHAIRRALGENSDGRKFIETVKKHGFRFVAEVRKIEEPLAGSSGPATAPSGDSKQPALVRQFPRLVARAEPHISGAALAAAAPEPRTTFLPDAVPARRQVTLRPIPERAPVKRRWPFIRLAGVAALLLVLAAGASIYRYMAAESPAPPAPRLAVLPLKTLDAGDNYLALGVADAVIRRISQTGTMTVRPTGAVRRYLDEDTDALTAARALDADVVLEGTLLRAGDRLRVSVNLLRAVDGKSLWADNFDMSTADAFAIQDKVAQQIASSLSLHLDPAQRARFASGYTPNAIAYEYYLKGVYNFDQRWFNIENKPQMEATIALYKKSIEADPNFALAHAQLAYAYAWMAVYIDVSAQAEWVERAKEEIGRTDALDPQLAETHIVRHHILLSAHEGYQLEAAIREALLARQLDPNIGAADLAADFNHLGLEDMFEREKQRTLDIDPTSEFNKNLFSVLYSNARRYDDWLAYRQKYLDGQPDVQYLLGTGRLDEAQQRIERILAKKPDDPWMRDSRAMLLALRGDHRGAEAEIPFLIDKVNSNVRGYHHHTYDIACIYALGGKSAEAVKWLRETAATGFPSYPTFERDRYLDHIRQTPEFVQFMAEMKAQNEKVRREFVQ